MPKHVQSFWESETTLFSADKCDQDINLLILQLFELLGFDRFEFIQRLLENRKSLIAVTIDSATDELIRQGKFKRGAFIYQCHNRYKYYKTVHRLYGYQMQCQVV